MVFLLLLAVAACAPACRHSGKPDSSAAKKNPAPASANVTPQPLHLKLDHAELDANGTDRATFTLAGGKNSDSAEWDIQYQAEPVCAKIIEQTDRSLILQSTLAPCHITVTASAGSQIFTKSISIQEDLSDSDGDGFPDVVELTAASDRSNFRAWFTTIAASQFEHASDAWPAEKRDCAGLIRFAFVEALKKHDTETLSKFKYLARTGMPDVRKFNYPDAPLLGDAMFRTRAGAFKVSDLDDGSFQPYVIARLLQEANTHFVSRHMEDALPGDLIFFLRFAESDMPYHSMIYLGADPGGEPALVYHTGPVNGTAGRIKLITVAELMAFPDMRWRPASENDNFLGVYRFNILD
jgi:hypothetical protein